MFPSLCTYSILSDIAEVLKQIIKQKTPSTSFKRVPKVHFYTTAPLFASLFWLGLRLFFLLPVTSNIPTSLDV